MNSFAVVKQSWREKAVCVTADPELFFTEHQGQRPTRGKAVCIPCPVKDECLEHALTQREYFGVWGGLSERERKALLRERRMA